MKQKLLHSLAGLTATALFLSCSVSGDKVSDWFAPIQSEQKTITALPLAGTVQGKYFKFNQGFARVSNNGEYSLTWIKQDSGYDCSSTMAERPYMSALVPQAKGTYSYDMDNFSSILRPVNFVLSNPTSGIVENVIADSSTIMIEDINLKTITGRLAAKSTAANLTYDVSGAFQLLNCANPVNQALKITQVASDFLIPKYSEIVTYIYADKKVRSLRVMDHVPASKCNTDHRWYNSEYPVKYIEVALPNAVGEFKINLKDLALGFQDSQGGQEYSTFEGTGEVIAQDLFRATVTLSAKDTIYNKYQVIGRLTSNICE